MAKPHLAVLFLLWVVGAAVGAARAIPSLSQLYHSVAHLYNKVHRHQNVQITWRTHFPQSALIIRG